MKEYADYWDKTVKPLAQEVIDKATKDKELISYYVSQMIFAVEHDIADGRYGLMSLNFLGQVKGVFSSKTYFESIHKNTSKEEINRMKNLSEKIEKLMSLMEA